MTHIISQLRMKYNKSWHVNTLILQLNIYIWISEFKVRFYLVGILLCPASYFYQFSFLHIYLLSFRKNKCTAGAKKKLDDTMKLNNVWNRLYEACIPYPCFHRDLLCSSSTLLPPSAELKKALQGGLSFSCLGIYRPSLWPYVPTISQLWLSPGIQWPRKVLPWEMSTVTDCHQDYANLNEVFWKTSKI